MLIKIAAIIGYGRNINPLLNKRSEKMREKSPIINAAYLLFAPESILRLVLTNTAVTGSPPKSHDAIFDIARPKTSFCFENLSFVIFCAICAEIIVSSIAIMATTRDTFMSSLKITIKSQRLFIFFVNGENISI